METLRRRKIGASRVFKKRKSTSKKSSLAVFPQNEDTSVSKELSLIDRNNLSILPNLTTSTSNVIASDEPFLQPQSNKNESNYVIIDLNIIVQILTLVGTCPDCESKSININIDHKNKKGLSSLLLLSCTKCSWKTKFYTSKKVASKTSEKSFDINLRSVVGMREIGKGLSALEKLCGFLNLPPPIQKATFNDVQNKILLPYKCVAMQSMINAALEFKLRDDTGVSDITVSCDGTWQKRGHNSLNGIVSVIAVDTGKCLDYRVRTKKCKACELWEDKFNSDEYEEFMQKHKNDCHLNHIGSAGSMEAAGLVECFNASVLERKLRYINYLGDGDSKAFSDIQKQNPYGKEITKLECVGHIQKRVGARLRKLKATNKSLLSDGKKLGGVGRLTDKKINKLQNYFGIAIRQCCGKSVYELKKAIGAVLFYCSEASSSDVRHAMCPQTNNTWCKYQADKINKTNVYKEKPGLPIVIRDIIKPVFIDLSDESLLKKCLHGKTQNNNEALNAIIWKRCPKDVYVGQTALEIGTASAVINFNEGLAGMLNVYSELGINPGKNCITFCNQRDSQKIKNIATKLTDEVKQRRKQIRAKRKGYSDQDKESEGIAYSPGSF
ncbi:uncharacterized protein LOC136093423 [Hydra vulgaris]|uniref:uncharacterized protein LOC136093423 n=1 Tax=Hydra vulgaris TaxID=6087 RepID=UPI0032EA5F06